MSFPQSHRRQRGQALTEFIIIALALVPLFLLMPMIAKYQDLAHATEMASRYVAFEATTRNDQMGQNGYKTPAELTTEVQRRFFSNPDAPIKTGDAPGDFKGHQNMFWRDQHGDALIKKFADISVSFGESSGTDHSDAFTGTKDGAPFVLSPLNVKNALKLKSDGIYQANVTVKLANLDSVVGSWTKAYDEFRNINLSMTRSTGLVINSWTAESPDEVDGRIHHSLALFPSKFLMDPIPGAPAPLDTPENILNAAVVLVELPKCFPSCTPSTRMGPKIGHLDFWQDTVPKDRLK